MATRHRAAPEIGRRGTRLSPAPHGRRHDSSKASGRSRSYLRLTLGLALWLALVLVTGCGSASPATSSTGSNPATAAPSADESGQAGPSGAASSNTFASQLYGYELVLPPGWQVHPAASQWLSRALEGRCPDDWDCFSSPSGEPTLAAAATSVAPDLTLDQWRSRMHVGLPGGCFDSAEATATTLGGEPAQTWTTTCEGEGLHATKLVALHAGRGYILLLASPISIGLEADRATLNSILAAFRFASS